MRPLTAHEAQRDGGLAASAIAAHGDGDGVVRAVHANAIRRGRRLVGGGWVLRPGIAWCVWVQCRASKMDDRQARVPQRCCTVFVSLCTPVSNPSRRTDTVRSRASKQEEKEHRVSNASSRVVRAVKPGRMNKGRRAGLGSRFNIGIQRACAKNIYINPASPGGGNARSSGSKRWQNKSKTNTAAET